MDTLFAMDAELEDSANDLVDMPPGLLEAVNTICSQKTGKRARVHSVENIEKVQAKLSKRLKVEMSVPKAVSLLARYFSFYIRLLVGLFFFAYLPVSPCTIDTRKTSIHARKLKLAVDEEFLDQLINDAELLRQVVSLSHMRKVADLSTQAIYSGDVKKRLKKKDEDKEAEEDEDDSNDSDY